jgi:Domain of unknown function (DUF4282)
MDDMGTSSDPAQVEPPTSARSGQPDRFDWGDFFAFRVMVTPVVIRIVYAIGVVLITLGAILIPLAMPTSTCVSVDDSITCTNLGPGPMISGILAGVVVFIVGQLYWRVITELLYVIFGIHESVRGIERRGG